MLQVLMSSSVRVVTAFWSPCKVKRTHCLGSVQSPTRGTQYPVGSMTFVTHGVGDGALVSTSVVSFSLSNLDFCFSSYSASSMQF